jgi:hypothetical protein
MSSTTQDATGSEGDASSTEADTTGSEPLTFVDDELDGEFGLGTFEDTVFIDGVVEISSSAATGTFTSRVFDAGQGVAWTGISWRPLAPYGKPLPDRGDSEAGYAEGSFDGSDLVLLYHLDEAGPLSPNVVLLDDSGRENHARVGPNSPDLTSTAGRFAGGIDLSPAGYFYLDLGTTEDLDFGTSDFTWALWINTEDDCRGTTFEANRTYMGADDDRPDGAHMWFGCGRVEPDSPLGGHAGGTFWPVFDAPAPGGGFGGTRPIADGAWHLLVVTKTGHADATLAVYVDGALDGTSAAQFAESFTFDDDPWFTFGITLGASAHAASGVFDEIAVWRRALGVAEVESLYRRGALRLSLRVRVCTTPTCADEPAFVDASGDPGGAISDPPGALGPESTITLSGMPSGRYFQYRVSMDGAPDLVADRTPRLDRVTVYAGP